jgi:hypothetical protein
MDWKSTLKGETEKALLKKAAGKILPMEDVATSRFGAKARVVAACAGIGTVLALILHYLGN